MAKEKEDVLTEEDEDKVEYVPVDEKPEPEDDDEDDDAPKVVSEEEDNAGDDEEREKIRERRRLEKKERAERRKQAMNRDRVELDFLRNRNDDLERRLTGIETKNVQSELDGIKHQLQSTVKDIETAEKIIAKAIEAGDGEDVTKAMKYRDAAINKARQLDYTIKQRSQAPKPAQQQVDPAIMSRAQSFFEDTPWYNPQNPDEDTSIVMAIDQSLTREGKDPKSDEYWAELRKRVKKRLPERFEAEKVERTQRGGPNIGSGKEYAPSSTKREVYISPERKQALVDAGVWDDPLLRQRYIKQYMKYDQQAKA